MILRTVPIFLHEKLSILASRLSLHIPITISYLHFIFSLLGCLGLHQRFTFVDLWPRQYAIKSRPHYSASQSPLTTCHLPHRTHLEYNIKYNADISTCVSAMGSCLDFNYLNLLTIDIEVRNR